MKEDRIKIDNHESLYKALNDHFELLGGTQENKQLTEFKRRIDGFNEQLGTSDPKKAYFYTLNYCMGEVAKARHTTQHDHIGYQLTAFFDNEIYQFNTKALGYFQLRQFIIQSQAFNKCSHDTLNYLEVNNDKFPLELCYYQDLKSARDNNDQETVKIFTDGLYLYFQYAYPELYQIAIQAQKINLEHELFFHVFDNHKDMDFFRNLMALIDPSRIVSIPHMVYDNTRYDASQYTTDYSKALTNNMTLFVRQAAVLYRDTVRTSLNQDIVDLVKSITEFNDTVREVVARKTMENNWVKIIKEDTNPFAQSDNPFAQPHNDPTVITKKAQEILATIARLQDIRTHSFANFCANTLILVGCMSIVAGIACPFLAAGLSTTQIAFFGSVLLTIGILACVSAKKLKRIKTIHNDRPLFSQAKTVVNTCLDQVAPEPQKMKAF